jgi:hypothetical protein
VRMLGSTLTEGNHAWMANSGSDVWWWRPEWRYRSYLMWVVNVLHVTVAVTIVVLSGTNRCDSGRAPTRRPGLGPDSDSDFSLVSFGRSGMGVDLRRPKAACDTYLTFCGSLQQLARARGKYTG